MPHIRDHCSSSFLNDTATTEIYTLSLHDALPIYPGDQVDLVAAQPRQPRHPISARVKRRVQAAARSTDGLQQDRKSTRLNSSHVEISYAVFCLKKKNRCIPDSLFDEPLGRIVVIG